MVRRTFHDVKSVLGSSLGRSLPVRGASTHPAPIEKIEYSISRFYGKTVRLLVFVRFRLTFDHLSFYCCVRTT